MCNSLNHNLVLLFISFGLLTFILGAFASLVIRVVKPRSNDDLINLNRNSDGKTIIRFKDK
jgi:hypothetical protein